MGRRWGSVNRTIVTIRHGFDDDHSLSPRMIVRKTDMYNSAVIVWGHTREAFCCPARQDHRWLS